MEKQGANGESAEVKTTKTRRYPNGQDPMLRYIRPYWWPYRTFVKERWRGRQILEVISTEFRDRSVSYYRHALESGVTRVNGVTAHPDLVLRDGDRIDNTVHRHEPPITNDPILVLHTDRDKGFVIISKPGSIPVHATGRYFRHTVLEIMESDHGMKCYSVNRLDRPTSGLMILALTSTSARDLAKEFTEGKVRKEYVARVKGKFPEEIVVVDQPLLTVDRQMGLVIITPEGKDAKTLFKRMSYDAERDQSVLHCRPVTGRTHQIRVHLQYLGHPIANDPLYSHKSIWGSNLGRGGVDLVPHHSALSSADAMAARVVSPKQPPSSPIVASNAETPGETPTPTLVNDLAAKAAGIDLDDREYANIDVTSPIRLSQQAREIIAKLRRARDEQEDWAKWKEVVFRAKKAQDDMEASSAVTPATQAQEEGVTLTKDQDEAPLPSSELNTDRPEDSTIKPKAKPHPRLPNTRDKAPLPDPLPDDHGFPLARPDVLPPGFCDQCFVPLPDDPDPENLFIYLHALRYTTPNLGEWSTPLPRWAEEAWNGDWRGWSDHIPPVPLETQDV